MVGPGGSWRWGSLVHPRLGSHLLHTSASSHPQELLLSANPDDALSLGPEAKECAERVCLEADSPACVDWEAIEELLVCSLSDSSVLIQVGRTLAIGEPNTESTMGASKLVLGCRLLALDLERMNSLAILQAVGTEVDRSVLEAGMCSSEVSDEAEIAEDVHGQLCTQLPSKDCTSHSEEFGWKLCLRQ